MECIMGHCLLWASCLKERKEGTLGPVFGVAASKPGVGTSLGILTRASLSGSRFGARVVLHHSWASQQVDLVGEMLKEGEMQCDSRQVLERNSRGNLH